MPLELSDYEKIHNDIDKAVSQLQKSLDRQDAVLDNLMPRKEYEQRHAIIEQQIVVNSAAIAAANVRINDFAKWAMDQHEKLRQLAELQAEKFRTDIEDTRKEIRQHKEETSVERRDTIKTIVGYIITAVLSSGVVATIEYYLTHGGK